MSSHFRWDDPVFNTGDYIKFNNKGDTISGQIEALETFTFPDKEKDDGSIEKGNTVPVLKLRVAKDQLVTVTCSNTHLLEKVRSLQPQVGDGIDITYVDDTTTKYGGRKKMFLVRVIKPTTTTVSDDREQGPDF